MANSATYNRTKVHFAEGSAASTPDASEVVIYAKADGLMYSKDDAGTETLMSGGDVAAHTGDTTDAHDASAISFDPTGLSNVTGTDVQTAIEELDAAAGGSGAVATDTIWDAAGDLVQGTGSNTAARLALGASGTVVRSNGTNNAYGYPPGYEMDYVQITSGVSITATVEASSDVILTSSAIAYDGSTVVMIEAFLPDVEADATAGRFMYLNLFDGTSAIGRLCIVMSPTTDGHDRRPVHIWRRLTPTAATHTYSVRGQVSAGQGEIRVGAGGAGASVPAFIRITRVSP